MPEVEVILPRRPVRLENLRVERDPFRIVEVSQPTENAQGASFDLGIGWARDLAIGFALQRGPTPASAINVLHTMPEPIQELG